ncbi:MAG TPA: LysR family transcriptional regulator [Desulfobacteraceae bacterium]|nr:LysR family transcriptional regulator [Desulfobacteraceae bacterium]
MNLNQLKIFYFAAKRGNLNMAARDLFVTQPAVTKGIQRLQEHYDIKLVNRFGKKLVLTDAGQALFEISEKIFDLESLAEETIREFQRSKRGKIRLLASESFGAYYLPSVMTPFLKDNPFVFMSVNILPSEEVGEDIANLRADLGFTSFPIDNPKLQVHEILEDELVVIVRPGHKLAGKESIKPVDLEGENLIYHERGSVPHQAINSFLKGNSVSVSVSMELSSNRAMKQAVENGIGAALISRHVADEEVQAGRLIALSFENRPLKRKYFMIYHKEKYISEILKRFIDRLNQWGAEYTRCTSR